MSTIQVIAVETGYYGGTLRHKGQEFSIPEGEKLVPWMVKKGEPMPSPPKSFVRTAKELAAQVDPNRVPDTRSAKARLDAIEKGKRLEARTAQPAPKAPA